MKLDQHKIAEFLKNAIDDLVNTDYSCTWYDLDEDLAIFVGWTEGYDPNDKDYIHSKEDPTYVIAAKIASTHEYMKTDLDWLVQPYYEDGEVWDTEITLTENNNFEEDAKWFIDSYKGIRKALDNGELLLENKKLVKEVLLSSDINKRIKYDFEEAYKDWGYDLADTKQEFIDKFIDEAFNAMDSFIYDDIDWRKYLKVIPELESYYEKYKDVDDWEIEGDDKVAIRKLIAEYTRSCLKSEYKSEDVLGNMNEAKFKDKVKAIKKSLKKNDKRISDKTAQQSAERIAGSMIKNEGWNPDKDLYVKLMKEIQDNLGIDRYEIQKDGDSIKFRYNDNVYFAEPRSTCQVDVFDGNHKQIGWGVVTHNIKQEVFTDYIANQNFIYELVGGDYAGTYTREEAEKLTIKEPKLTDDLDDIRANGGFVHRKELDNQLQFKGYLGPMWGGTKDGKAVMRYETQDVYDMLSEKKTLNEKDSEIYDTEVAEKSNFINENLNTGVLPIVDVDLYSKEEILPDNVESYKDLDNIIKDIAPQYIEEAIKTVLPSAKVTPTAIYHPREYNFSGDELEFDLTVDSNEYNALKQDDLVNSEFEQYLKDNYSSGSGFISSMANNLNSFNSQSNWQQVVQVIMFALRDYDFDSLNDRYLEDFIDSIHEEFGYDFNDELDESKKLQEDEIIDRPEDLIEDSEEDKAIHHNEDGTEKTILDYLEDRVGQEIEVGRLNTILQSIFGMYQHIFIMPEDLYNMDLDYTQTLTVNLDGEEYDIYYDIVDVDSGIVKIVEVEEI